MTGVQNSSSQASSSVTQQSAAPRAFDVGSEGELLQLLNFIRRGPFLPDQKNMLRDAVLDFVVTKNTEVLGVVSSALARSNATLTQAGASLRGGQSAKPEEVVPAVENLSVEVVSSTSFGSRRPQPTFGQPVAAHSPQAAPMSNEESLRTKSVPVQSVDSDPAPATAKPTTASESPAPAPTPTTPDVMTPRSDNPVSESTPTPDPLSRIKEIKNSVNKRVGNPVNLIDSNNEVGREYMNALLGAMKSVNGGTHEEVTLAMQRLEKAYAAVETSLNAQTTMPTLDIVEEQDELQPAPDMSASETVSPTSVETTQTDRTVLEQSAPETDGHVSEPQSTTAAEQTPPLTSETHTENVPPFSQDSETLPQPSVSMSQIVSEDETPKETQTAAPAHAVEQVPTESPDPAVSQTDSAIPPQSLAAKVAEQRAKRADLVEKKAAEIQMEKVATMNDPLHTESVDKGLEQLLSEWKLFKSSGIFGTGPSGYDHPLFKAIAPLPMAAVIAGRFEGVNPEIRQSISDYMSGWRYEQGIVHEMNESFEHYLRRIVHKILENKPKK